MYLGFRRILYDLIFGSNKFDLKMQPEVGLIVGWYQTSRGIVSHGDSF